MADGTEDTQNGEEGNTTLLSNTEDTTDVSDDTSDSGQGTDSDNGDGKSKEDNVQEWGVDSLKAPEGFDILDANSVEELATQAKKMGLDAEGAQAMLEFQSSAILKVVDAHNEQWDNTMNEWVEQARSDKDIGGPKLEETLQNGRKALNTFGNNGLAALIDNTGLGNNVEFLRFMDKIGRAIQEDRIQFGGTSDTATKKSAAELMYPTMAN